MNEAKSNLAAAARLLSTMSASDWTGDEPPSVVVEIEQLDDLGALLIRTLHGIDELEREVERVRRELATADEVADYPLGGN